MIVMEGTQGVSYRAWVVCLCHVRRKNRSGRTENRSRLLAFLPFGATILEPYLLRKETFRSRSDLNTAIHVGRFQTSDFLCACNPTSRT